MTVSDFCLVFPWYENGNTMDYVKKPTVNRPDLLLGSVNGLRFPHEKRLVHSSLRPGHILIGDNGTARLATPGCSPIAAVPGTLAECLVQLPVDGDEDFNYRIFCGLKTTARIKFL
ncbi:hypothetical protein BDM02DRAFT_3123470 [Thelephora ganbajun]|uniref:Uncharacterized protein n=1 Tax=Thelephora ganbajun TaxID=370292 RepID=A0ACB6Z1J5_THEGA|nr:hypothetical protein BDM02DRAFT_3123470 [Thelephora ganbajun]